MTWCLSVRLLRRPLRSVDAARGGHAVRNEKRSTRPRNYNSTGVPGLAAREQPQRENLVGCQRARSWIPRGPCAGDKCTQLGDCLRLYAQYRATACLVLSSACPHRLVALPTKETADCRVAARQLQVKTARRVSPHCALRLLDSRFESPSLDDSGCWCRAPARSRHPRSARTTRRWRERC